MTIILFINSRTYPNNILIMYMYSRALRHSFPELRVWNTFPKVFNGQYSYYYILCLLSKKYSKKTQNGKK